MRFNVRVYGLLIYNQRVLLSDEKYKSTIITKFPGGGLEFGEGLHDGLKREFMEECGIEIDIISHFYTTDFFQASAFDDSQILSIYYLVKSNSVSQFPNSTTPFFLDDSTTQHIRFHELNELKSTSVTLPIDRVVVRMLMGKE